MRLSGCVLLLLYTILKAADGASIPALSDVNVHVNVLYQSVAFTTTHSNPATWTVASSNPGVVDPSNVQVVAATSSSWNLRITASSAGTTVLNLTLHSADTSEASGLLNVVASVMPTPSSSTGGGPAIGNSAVRLTMQFLWPFPTNNQSAVDNFVNTAFRDMASATGVSSSRFVRLSVETGGQGLTLVTFVIAEGSGERLPDVVAQDLVNQTAYANSPFMRSASGALFDTNFTPLSRQGFFCAPKFVTNADDCKTDDDKLFGYPRLYVYIAGAGAVVIILVILILLLCCCCGAKDGTTSTGRQRLQDQSIELADDRRTTTTEVKRGKSFNIAPAADNSFGGV